MRVSFTVFGLPPSHYAPVVEKAEALGFDAVWFADHLITPLSIDTPYPYHPSGRPGYTVETPISDVWAVIAHAAARTSSLSLGTGVFVLPLRNPFVVAQAAATVQNLSAGRLLFGVGTGWMREEYEAAGVPWSGRGERLEESLQVLRALWTGGPVDHAGRHFAFGPVQLGGAPRRPLPIVFGGASSRALERTGRLGDGWYGPACDLRASLQYRERIERHRSEAGRTERPFRWFVRVHDPDVPSGAPAAALLRRYAEAGFDDLVVPVWRARAGSGMTVEERVADLEAVVEACRAAGLSMERLPRGAAQALIEGG